MSGCYRLSLRYSAGDGPATLIAKLPSPDPAVRAGGATTYATEVRFYRDIASTVAVRAPECSCAVVNDDGTSFVLLLEDMAPAEQGDQIAGCTLEQAHDAVVNLAGLHGPRWCDESLHAIPGLAPFGAEAAEGMGIAFGMMVEPFIERYGTPDRRCRRVARVRTECRALDARPVRPLRARARRLPPRQPVVRHAGRRATVHRGRLATRRRRTSRARPRVLPRHRPAARRARPARA